MILDSIEKFRYKYRGAKCDNYEVIPFFSVSSLENRRFYKSKRLLDIIKYPILTEKTIGLIEKNQYSFAVDLKSDKTTIKYAIESLFDVNVVSVNTSLLPSKKRRVGQYIGKSPQYKKAIVKLSVGNVINIFEES